MGTGRLPASYGLTSFVCHLPPFQFISLWKLRLFPNGPMDALSKNYWVYVQHALYL